MGEDTIYKILRKYKVNDSEARNFIDGKGSESVNMILRNFVIAATKPFVKFSDDILEVILKDKKKSTEILLAMDAAIESVEEGLVSNSRSLIGDMISGKIKSE